MNYRVLLLFMIGAAGLQAADSPRTPEERPRLTPAAVAASMPSAKAETKTEDHLTMAPFEVPGSRLPMERSNAEQAPHDRAFDIQQGGTLVKHTTASGTSAVKIQYNAEHKGWDMLTFNW